MDPMRRRNAPLTTWALSATVVMAVIAGTAACTRDTSTGSASSTSASSSAEGCVGALDGPDTREYRQLPGIDPSLLSLDVYRRPAATGCPVVVWIHGGGWTTGDKQGKAIRTKVDWAGRHGVVLVSVNYRLATPTNDVRWPAFGQDVATSVAWVVEHATELGADPARLVLMGHSAGAHLATIVSVHPTLLTDVGLERSAIRCVVSLDSASYDLTRYDDGTDAGAQDAPALVRTAFGDDPTTLADGSPQVQVRQHPGTVADLLVVTRGLAQRKDQARSYAGAVSATGAATQVVDATGYTHEQVNTQLGAPGEQVETPAVDAFLAGCVA